MSRLVEAQSRLREAILEVRGLDIRMHRGDQVNHALRGVDLTVSHGEIIAVVGESGSGKSTLGLAILGLLPGDSRPVVRGSITVGAVEVVGASSVTLRDLRRHSLGAVFQDPMSSLDPTMRIGRQLAEACRQGVAPVEWLRRVGIADPEARVHAFPHQLSGGQRQRVMIAMAMAAGAALVIADEPTTALDVTVQAQILNLFRGLRKESGTAFIFITHDLAVATNIADTVLVMYGGRIIEQGPIEQVIRRPAHPYTAALLEARFGMRVEKAKQLPTLPGEPPSAGDEPVGCQFAPRCPLVVDRCHGVVPALVSTTQHEGTAACIRSDSVSTNLWRKAARPWPVERGKPDRAKLVAELDHVSVAFAGRGHRGRAVQALDDVTLQVTERESVALVGESGSGKSTVLRLVAGLLRPSSGRLTVRTANRPQMIYQDASASLTPWLTVGELVGERLRVKKLSPAERSREVMDALSRVGLSAEIARMRPPQLSGGQRQRVAIARAVVVPPELLLCDEPTSAVDVSVAAGILNLLGSLRRELGMAILFVTHDLSAARFVADRLIVMSNGKVIEQGESEKVINHPAHDYTRSLIASMPVHVAAAR